MTSIDSAQSKVHLTYSVQFLLGGKVDSLQLFLSTDPYSKIALANSISLVAVDGNNYAVFNANISCTIQILFLQFLIHTYHMYSIKKFA